MITKQLLEQFISQGYTKKQVSEELGIGYSTVYWHMSKHGLSFNNTENHRRVTIIKCITCGESDHQKFYKGRKSQCKDCFNAECGEKLKEKKTKAVDFKGGKCQTCGYHKSVAALEFHHLDPTQKDPQYRMGWSWERLQKELDKCILLCSNCHREEHERLRLMK